jgi:hypothetical protein
MWKDTECDRRQKKMSRKEQSEKTEYGNRRKKWTEYTSVKILSRVFWENTA